MSLSLGVVQYEDPVEQSVEIALEKIEGLLNEGYPVSRRMIGLLLLQRDADIERMVRDRQAGIVSKIRDIVEETQQHYDRPLAYVINHRRQQEASRIAREVMETGSEKLALREVLSRLTMNPLTGVPILLAVLYFGLYKFVGGFGAGTLVDFLEVKVFEGVLNPFFVEVFTRLIPWPVVRSLFVGDYGVLTLGLRYAIAIILPIVTIFFMVFALIEDSGYLPRLAMLIDRLFKKIGLSGRAVIPMVLGFGCATMATMVTRTLPTKRERIIATMLLALAIPCSAQMGVILALLGGNLKALILWAGVIGGVFLLIGFLTARLLPGDKPTFYMEIPPLRWPKTNNVLMKTYTRVEWYLKEILPIFLFASALIWVGQVTGLFQWVIHWLGYPVGWIGLPREAAKAFLFGFFRRDYGVAGLYDLNKAGLLSGNQLVVACVALTLFLPCIAQLLVNIRERGMKVGFGISLITLFFSFSVAFTLNAALNWLGIVV